MNFKFVVFIEVIRTEGKFATRDEISQQIQDALENADPQSYEGDNGGQYETSDWTVEEVEPKFVPAPPIDTPELKNEEGPKV